MYRDVRKRGADGSGDAIMGSTSQPEIGYPIGGFLLLPSRIDGTTQLVGDRESTNLLRILTGTLLGIGVVIFSLGSVELLVNLI